jgi:trk system potassium uptake protein
VHIVILGCGRVGALLADQLDEAGHSVAIIDQEPRAFRRVSAGFSGQTITGVGFDRHTLEIAGIERAHAFAAVSSGDNTNIIAARTARETYGVENVVARIYDPRRAAIYQRLGIPTVATVSWTAEQIGRRLLPQGAQDLFTDPGGTVQLLEVAYHPGWIGEDLSALEQATNARTAYVTRAGVAVTVDSGLVLQDGDLLHLIVETRHREQVVSILARDPSGRAPA